MTKKAILLIVLIISTTSAFAQRKWNFDLGLGASLNTGNVNNCNISNDAAVKRNDSVVAFDLHYKLLYSALIDKNNPNHWEETNFEITSGVKMDLFQYSTFSPFLACEQLTNKYKGYDIKLSSLLGMKFKIYAKPSFCDYSISAAVVYDWIDYTEETSLPSNNYRLSIRPKFTQRLSESLTLHHCTYYQPSLLKFSDFIVNSTTKLETKINKILFLDLAFTYEYRSEVPSEDYKHSDLRTEVSIKLKIQ